MKHRKIYSKIPVEHILTDPYHILSKDVGKRELGTTDSVVNMNGGIGFCYETGQKDDTGRVDNIFRVVLNLLQEVKVLDKNPSKSVQSINKKQKVYRLVEIIRAKEQEFIFEEHLSLGFSLIQQGEKIGYYPDTGACEYSPRNGQILFQKRSKGTESSNSLCYIAEEV